MPPGGTHLNANGLKYGVQQFKPVPAGSPTGFGNFSNPNGYAMNAPGVVGGATGLEDSSRLKYKDGNLYVPNPQVCIELAIKEDTLFISLFSFAQIYSFTRLLFLNIFTF